MRTNGNMGGMISYQPNSQGVRNNQPEYAEPALTLEGDADHWDHHVDEDYYEQPGILFRKMSPEQQQVLFENTARAINGVAEEVLLRNVENCMRAAPLPTAKEWRGHSELKRRLMDSPQPELLRDAKRL